NYRSSKIVVETARLLDNTYEVASEHPIKGDIQLLVGDNEESEAIQILHYLSSLLKNGHKDIEGKITLDRCAILGRNRYVFSSIEERLKESGWAYYKHLSTQHTSESDLLRDFELCLRLRANPRDRLHLEVLLNRWELNTTSIMDATYSDFDELFQKILNSIQQEENKAVLQSIDNLGSNVSGINFSSALDTLEQYVQKENEENERALILNDIKEWRRAWDHFLRSEPGGEHRLASFLGHVALGGAQQPRQDGLALLTVHSAKGLEFDVIVVMGMMQGVFPDYRARGAELEEEKRNFFVAITRSKRLLCFSYAKSRIMPWGDPKYQLPSPYLKQIGLI
ncbi:ATP-binding domain-containing protein, partial [bacterium]|nr:ATP-binding domain-containing protein [bacterium]